MGFLLAPLARADTPDINHTMASGVGDLDYNPGTKRFGWWSGQGACGVEFWDPAVVSLSAAAAFSFRRDDGGMGCGGAIQGLTTDQGYVYFTQGGWLWRLALGAPATQAPSQLPLGVSSGFTPTALARSGDNLFWVESNGTFSKLWKADRAGTGSQQLVQTGNWGTARKLRLFYDIGSAHFPLSCLLLSDSGQLWKGTVDPAGPFTLLASGIADFEFRFDQGPFLLFCRVFAVQSGYGGQLLALHYNTGASSSLYTTDSDKSLTAVATDDRRVYLIETLDPCPEPFKCVGYNLWRQDRPWNGSAAGSWVNFGYAQDGLVVNPHSLYSVDKLLVWADGTTIRSISADAPAVFLNFLAVGLEVVQAIQNLNNDVPLIQGKPTYVRAYARTDFNTTGSPKFFPSGLLKVSSRLTPFDPFQERGTLHPIQTPAVDTNSDLQVLRTDLTRGYVFELPPEWTRNFQLQCEFIVNSNRVYRENVGFDPYGDNSVTQIATLVPSGEQCWVFVAIKNAWGNRYDPQIERYGSDFWRIMDRTISMLPVEKARVQIHTWPDQIGPVGSRGLQGFTIRNGGDWNNMRAAMGFWSIGRSQPCGCERFIGTVDPTAVLAGSTTGIGGECPFFANSAVVMMDTACRRPWNCPNGGVTLAHELGHTFCRSHVNCPPGKPAGPDANYPYPSCTLTIPNFSDPAAHYGFDPLSYSVVDPAATADTMSYAGSTWPSDYTWNALFAYGNGPCFPGGKPAAAALARAAANSNDQLVLTGSLDEESERVELFPAFLLPPEMVDLSQFGTSGAPAVQSNYVIGFLDGNGSTLIQVPLRLEESDNHEQTSIRQFGQALSLPAGAQVLQILHNGQVRAERYFSPHPPVLTLAPPYLDTNSQTLECAWSASDADGDPLTFILQYSSDDGATWLPLQAGSAATSHVVDARELPGGPQARIRVIATDGLNSAVATSDPFVMPNNPPVAVILGLRDGDQLTFGSLQTLSGVGHDHEDGMLDPGTLQWTLSGPVSEMVAGERLSLRDLTPGTYVATLSASDSAGLTGSNSVQFEVQPLTVPERPAPVVDGLCADDTYVDALEIPFSFGWPEPAYARLSHGDGFLHVAFTGLPFSSSPDSPLSVGLVVDPDGSRGAAPQTNDVGFFVDETGLPSQRNGDGAAMALNLEPSLGVESAVFRGDNAWSAELNIPDSLVGGWGHAAGLVIHVQDQNHVVSKTWPEFASTASPDTWVPALFGLAPPASNHPPVAVVRMPREQVISAPELIVLNGQSSFDPEGQPLTYRWTQLAGPSVTLSNTADPSPAFVWAPTNQPVEFRFGLVVNDGELDSASAEAAFTIYSVTLNPQPLPPVQRDPVSGVVSSALSWPGTMGDRCVIEASQDLKQWIPVATNTVDFDGRIHFRDPSAKNYSHRFYRAGDLTSTSLVAYHNDFEGAVGAEWTPRAPVDTTPAGARHFLGQFGAETISLTLNALPAHTRMRVSCDLFIIGSWAGNNPEVGPDRWQLQVRGGLTLVDATFSTYSNQSYPGTFADQFPARTGAAENDTLGYTLRGFGGADSVYGFEFSFDHSDAGLVLDFSGIGLGDINKESWGLDNVQIELINNP